MGNVDASRLWNNEGAYSWRSNSLDELLLELDMRIAGNECYIDISRSGPSDFISQIDYYSDLARTDKVADRVFSRTGGKITQIVSTFYNKDTSTDSVVTETITRNASGKITSCDSVFTTSESQKL